MLYDKITSDISQASFWSLQFFTALQPLQAAPPLKVAAAQCR